MEPTRSSKQHSRISRKLAAIATTAVVALGIALAPTATATAAFGFDVTTASIGPLTAGKPVSIQLQANAAATWTGIFTHVGSQPINGLSISSGGVVSGTPSSAGVSRLTATAWKSGSINSDTKTFLIDVLPVATGAASSTATVGAVYSQQFGGTSALVRTFEVQGALPAGLRLNSSNGAITGTPSNSLGASNSAAYPIKVRVVTGVYLINEQKSEWVSHTITLAHTAPTVTAPVLPIATVGTAYSATISAVGNGTLSYSATGLPAGLAINAATGVISGTPTYVAGYTTASNPVAVTFTAANSTASSPVGASLTVLVPAPSLGAATLPDAAVGAAYSQTLPATGFGALSIALAPGSALPAGLSLSSTGIISGTPTYDSTYGASKAFTFKAIVSGPGGSHQVDYSLSVTVSSATLTTRALPEGWLTQGFSTLVEVAGPGAAATVTGLPNGLSFDGTTITGTPTESGDFAVTLTATNGAGFDSETVTLTVNAAPAITTGGLPAGIVGTTWSQQVAASGKNVTFSLGAAAPAGMTITPGGLLEWTPTADGIESVEVTAENLSGSHGVTLSLTSYGLPTLDTAAPAAATQGRLYLGGIDFAGRDVALTLTGGRLPSGVTFAADGSLRGTPIESGTFTFEVTATNLAGFVAETYRLVVAAPAVIPGVTPVPAPEATPAGIVAPITPRTSDDANAADADAAALAANSSGADSDAEEELPTLADSPEKRTVAAPADGFDPAGLIWGAFALLAFLLALFLLLARRRRNAE